MTTAKAIAKYSLYPIIAWIAILGLLTAFWQPVYATASEMIGYTTNDDGNATVYGVNWEGQTFTTANDTAHSVSSIRIKAWRTGSPSTITASIRVTTGGNITGTDLSSGTYDGNTITNSSPGEWVTINLSPTLVLVPDTQYGLVIRATAGDGSNYLNWRMDKSSPTYTGGSRSSSTDSGSTWANDNTADMMFAIWGESTFGILNVAAFASVFEQEDRYIVLHYNCMVPPGYPGGNPASYFSIVLFDGATEYAKIPLPAWGYKPAAIYLSPTAASGMSWGTSSVGLALEEVGGDLEATYMMQADDWKGVDIWELDSWVRSVAQDIEDFYGVNILLEEIPTAEGNLTLPAGEEVLSPLGGEIFQAGMYGLDELRPHLFYILVYSPEMPDTAFTHEYEETLDWETRLGTELTDDMNTAAAVVNLDGKTFAAMGLFLGYLAIVGVGVWRTGSPAIATGGAIPFLAGGMWMGLIALAVGAIITLLMLVLTVWIVFLRST